MNADRNNRRGFSLLEAVIVVLVLAVSVPPTVSWLSSAAASRSDSLNAVRATSLAGAVVETILADACSTSPGLGMHAFEDTAGYENAPITGLRDRLRSVTDLYEAMGFSYDVAFSALVDCTGEVNTEPTLNLFRKATVTVEFAPAAGAEPVRVAVEVLVTDV